MFRRSAPLSSLALLVVVACTDVVGPPDELASPEHAISDGANGGNESFFFLPPLVGDPAAAGTFDGGLAPVVSICELIGSSCGTVIAEFTMSTGPGSETVRVVPEDEHYIVNWHTNEFALDPIATYRMSVEVAGVELGSADVDVVNSGKDLKNVDTGEFVALKDGRTLPIKFRIEEGAVSIKWSDLELATQHGCALAENGKAFCWGVNNGGKLGTGDNNDSFAPAPVAGGHTFVAISTAHGAFTSTNGHTCGVAVGGTAYCWGENRQGQLGDGGTTSSLVPQQVAGGHTFADITTGDEYSCGVTAGDVARCWGAGHSGRLGDGTNSTRLLPTAVAGGLAFRAVRGLGDTSYGITTTDVPYAWGVGGFGTLGIGSNPASVSTPHQITGGLATRQIVAGSGHACLTTTAHQAYCWGFSRYGSVGDGTTTEIVPAPVAVLTTLTFQQVVAGAHHTCGLTFDNQAYCWGWNESGQVGDGSLINRLTPVPVETDLRFAKLGGGHLHTCGITTNGGLYCWGDNTWGQLGDGTAVNQAMPVRVLDPVAP